MDGLLALDFLDVVIEVLRSSNGSKHQPMEQQETAREITNSKPNQKGNRGVEQLSHADYVTTNANSSQGESQLYNFEDNEAVIKMIRAEVER